MVFLISHPSLEPACKLASENLRVGQQQRDLPSLFFSAVLCSLRNLRCYAIMWVLFRPWNAFCDSIDEWISDEYCCLGLGSEHVVYVASGSTVYCLHVHQVCFTVLYLFECFSHVTLEAALTIPHVHRFCKSLCSPFCKALWRGDLLLVITIWFTLRRYSLQVMNVALLTKLFNYRLSKFFQLSFGRSSSLVLVHSVWQVHIKYSTSQNIWV